MKEDEHTDENAAGSSQNTNTETNNTEQADGLRTILENAKRSMNDPRISRIIELPLDNADEAVLAARAPRRRQCANCTCGLSKKAPAAAEKPKKSACGNCSLGDAFRCDGCPYKGMPAFEEGKEFRFDDNLNDL